MSLKEKMPDILASAFVIIYVAIQWHVISNPGMQDDVISARVQDIMIMIMAYYFGTSKK